MEKLFQKIFPLHILIDRNLRPKSFGRSTPKMLPGLCHDTPLVNFFNVVRPRIKFSFEELQSHEDTLYLLQVVDHPEIQLKGQMTYVEECDGVLFVFTPIIRDVGFLKTLGMNMNDIPYFDNTLELLFALQATGRSLEESYALSRSFEEKVIERTAELQAMNEELRAKHEEFLQQQQQIHIQSLYLEEKNKKLQKARELIHSKNRELKQYNVRLENEVRERTQQLVSINKELVEHNNQLEQFAFIVAHNLRAPIARILGLINLMHLESLVDGKNSFYINSINLATQRLEEVIRDLNIILEIRKGISQAYERVSLVQKLDKVKETLRNQIEESGAVVTGDFSKIDRIYSISSYIENILYNLINNSIKYRDPERPLQVKVSSSFDNGSVRILVEDNGIGFDVEKNRENMFKLYKRFHDHVEGKGLGLYMIKTQVEALGGHVDVQSMLNEGTTFTIELKQ